MSRILILVLLSSTFAELALAQVEPRSRASRQPVTPVASSSPNDSASPAPHLYKRGSNLYEFILHQINPNEFDWGEWYEARRQALRDATAYNPDFWYCLLANLAFIVVFAALLKSMYDHKRKVHIMGRQMDEVRQHDAYSRRAAEEAIRRYNAHTELCNRVIEAEEGGLTIATGDGSRVTQLQADLTKALDEIEILKRDKSRLGAEIARPVTTTLDPPRRDGSTSNKGNGNGQGQTLPPSDAVSYADLVRQINSLQQQLHAERERNKHLKGGA